MLFSGKTVIYLEYLGLAYALYLMYLLKELCVIALSVPVLQMKRMRPKNLRTVQGMVLCVKINI